jgi:hypothetical protein
MIVCLFGHTAQGEGALKQLLEAGLPKSDLQVVGDLGEAGQLRHVTFDALHLPVAERELFMDTVRAGGVVLAVTSAAVEFVEKTAWEHKALKTLQTTAGGANPSHNVG